MAVARGAPAIAAHGHRVCCPDLRGAGWTEADDPAVGRLQRACKAWERYADLVELAYVDDAAHFIVDDAPAEMTTLALDWFDRAA